MIRKPWPIVFVSLFFLLIPIFNILITFFLLGTEHTFSDFLYSLAYIPKNYVPLFDMVVPSLIAAVSIYCVRKWSYPVFLVTMFWITLKMFYTFSAHLPFIELLFTILFPMIINIIFVSYILLPNVRAAYYDPRLRWWETKPRYLFSTEVKIELDGQEFEGKMTNISEGGLFSIINSPIGPDSVVKVTFEILETKMELAAKIVYQKPDGLSHGLQFFNLTREQKKNLKIIMARLAKDKYEETRPVPVWTEDLTKWFKTLIHTGKGLVPELPQRQNPGPK
jgi:hypothetical protein